MKQIKLRPEVANGSERISSLNILKLVAGNSPARALGVDEMRRRVRILDALDELPPGADSLILEDEEAKTLAGAIEAFPWASANRHLLAIIDDVLAATPVRPDA